MLILFNLKNFIVLTYEFYSSSKKSIISAKLYMQIIPKSIKIIIFRFCTNL